MTDSNQASEEHRSDEFTLSSRRHDYGILQLSAGADGKAWFGVIMDDDTAERLRRVANRRGEDAKKVLSGHSQIRRPGRCLAGLRGG
jgi:hypothetical protein